MMRRLQRCGASVVLSPHNTFARSGTARSQRTLDALIRRADVVIVFTQHDQDVLAQLEVEATRADLSLFLPAPSDSDVERWRSAYGDGPVALLSGQVRADKRPDVFVEACRLAGVTAAIVGPPNDGEHLVAQAKAGGGVVRIAKYVDSDEFTATLVAADVVVATHVIGSGSGPLAVARDLGVRTVAADVGGLTEFASTICRGQRAEDYAIAINEALADAPPEQHHSKALFDQHLSAYQRCGAE
jgi:glycosyltransferase involved in cell wall biosynthesis